MVRPEPLVDQLIEASKDEYVTRHLVDGRIINCDQRISFIAGYMTEEVAGLSAFNFMHREDVRWVMIALRQSKLTGIRTVESPLNQMNITWTGRFSVSSTNVQIFE